MTNKDRNTAERAIGIIEGIAMTSPMDICSALTKAVNMLNDVLIENKGSEGK